MNLIDHEINFEPEHIKSAVKLIVECLQLNNIPAHIAACAGLSIYASFYKRTGCTFEDFMQLTIENLEYNQIGWDKPELLK